MKKLLSLSEVLVKNKDGLFIKVQRESYQECDNYTCWYVYRYYHTNKFDTEQKAIDALYINSIGSDHFKIGHTLDTNPAIYNPITLTQSIRGLILGIVPLSIFFGIMYGFITVTEYINDVQERAIMQFLGIPVFAFLAFIVLAIVALTIVQIFKSNDFKKKWGV